MIQDCQQPKTGETWQQWIADAERRTQAGERQRWCLTCGLWKFAHELCSDAKTDKAVTAQ